MADALTAQDHLKRYDRYLQRRRNFDVLAQEIADYLIPYRTDILRRAEPGFRQTDYLTDSTAPHALDLFASTISAASISPGVEWFHLRMREETLNEDHAIKTWLERAEREMYLAFRQSNFYAEMDSGIHELGAFGTFAIYAEERPKRGAGFAGFRWKALPWGEYVVDEGPDGDVDTVYRCWRMSAKAIVQQWGTKAGPAMQERSQTTPEQMFEVLHCIFPRDFYSPRARTRKTMPWASVYVLKTGTTGNDTGESRILGEGGFEEFPCAVVRWAKTPGEMYGRSPAMTALPGVRTLNLEREMFLRAVEKHIDPPVMTPHDGVLATLQLFAGGVNPVLTEPGTPAIMPIETGGKLDWAQFSIADERAQIEKQFYLEQIQLPEKSNMTATEVERHAERSRRILGAKLSRFEYEGLNKVIDRAFGLMLRSGAFGPVPDQLRQAAPGDINLDVEYEGLLARAQRSARFFASAEVIQFMASVQPLYPQIMDNVDPDKLARDAMNVRGVPATVQTSDEERANIRNARAAEIDKQKQQEQLAGMAQAAGQAAPMVKEFREMSMNGQGGMAA